MSNPSTVDNIETTIKETNQTLVNHCQATSLQEGSKSLVELLSNEDHSKALVDKSVMEKLAPSFSESGEKKNTKDDASNQSSPSACAKTPSSSSSSTLSQSKKKDKKKSSTNNDDASATSEPKNLSTFERHLNALFNSDDFVLMRYSKHEEFTTNIVHVEMFARDPTKGFRLSRATCSMTNQSPFATYIYANFKYRETALSLEEYTLTLRARKAVGSIAMAFDGTFLLEELETIKLNIIIFNVPPEAN